MFEFILVVLLIVGIYFYIKQKVQYKNKVNNTNSKNNIDNGIDTEFKNLNNLLAINYEKEDSSDKIIFIKFCETISFDFDEKKVELEIYTNGYIYIKYEFSKYNHEIYNNLKLDNSFFKALINISSNEIILKQKSCIDIGSYGMHIPHNNSYQSIIINLIELGKQSEIINSNCQKKDFFSKEYHELKKILKLIVDIGISEYKKNTKIEILGTIDLEENVAVDKINIEKNDNFEKNKLTGRRKDNGYEYSVGSNSPINIEPRIVYDENGFDNFGIHEITKSIFDENGFDINGYGKDGFNKDGFNSKSLNRDGVHKLYFKRRE